MEDEELLEAVVAELVDDGEALVELVVADERPGAEDAAGDAGKGVGAELFELGDRGVRSGAP